MVDALLCDGGISNTFTFIRFRASNGKQKR